MKALLARHPRFSYFALGLLVALASVAATLFWLPVFRTVLGPQLSYDTRPWWLRAFMWVIERLPWIAAAIVLIARVRMGRGVRLIPYIAGALLPSVAMLLFLLGGPAVERAMHSRPFDAERWRANVGETTEWPARLEMVDALLASQRLRGASRDSVVRLLGPGDDPGASSGGAELVYRLGPERGVFRIDDELLLVRFGADGRVSECRVVAS